MSLIISLVIVVKIAAMFSFRKSRQSSPRLRGWLPVLGKYLPIWSTYPTEVVLIVVYNQVYQPISPSETPRK